MLAVDRLDRLADAILIAKRTRRIAVQSVLLGMGLAFGFMVAGAFGLFGPVGGAIVQELIDVAVDPQRPACAPGGAQARRRPRA